MKARSGRSDLAVLLFDADLYLGFGTRVESGAERLEVTAWIHPGRLILLILLGVAGAISVHRSGGHGVGTAIGGLLLLGALSIATVVQQKSFDRATRTVAKKTWLLGFPFTRTEEMHGAGAVRVQSEFFSSGEGQGYWELGVFVDGDTTGRVVSRDYEKVADFGRNLAGFLGLAFVDATAPESRAGARPRGW